LDSELLDYYRRRAAEYEAIYAKPERQDDLAKLRRLVSTRFRGANVLEIAAGTGYWTAVIADGARGIVATDMAEEPLRIAAAKPVPAGRVRFELADAYALPEALGRFDAAFAGFWWSHVSRKRLADFLSSLHGRLDSGARVTFLDNLYVQGSSTPVAGIDAEGNTFQNRKLADGSQMRIMKNFPAEAELREVLAPFGTDIEYLALEYYWVVSYCAK
jgi:SAM-dependent methyltransferase